MTTVLGAVAVVGLGLWLYSEKTGKKMWSNASGGSNGGSASRPRCALWRMPDNSYSGTGGNGGVCVARYAFN